MSKHQMENIYRDIPLERIPWNMEAPPEILQEIVNSSRIKPCKAIELGCGTGNYVMYLASRGFDVTGIDFSETAIEIGKNTAMDKGVTCHFMVADVLRLPEIGDAFDFAYDWELLHHIFPKERETYI